MHTSAIACDTFEIPAVDVPRWAASSIEAVVRFLVGELSATCCVSAEAAELVTGQVLRRESLGSTGLGRGAAIPNAKSDLVSQPGAVMGRLSHPLDWDAIDGEPVSRVYLLLVPHNMPGVWLRFLERTVRVIQREIAESTGTS